MTPKCATPRAPPPPKANVIGRFDLPGLLLIPHQNLGGLHTGQRGKSAGGDFCSELADGSIVSVRGTIPCDFPLEILTHDIGGRMDEFVCLFGRMQASCQHDHAILNSVGQFGNSTLPIRQFQLMPAHQGI